MSNHGTAANPIKVRLRYELFGNKLDVFDIESGRCMCSMQPEFAKGYDAAEAARIVKEKLATWGTKHVEVVE